MNAPPIGVILQLSFVTTAKSLIETVENQDQIPKC